MTTDAIEQPTPEVQRAIRTARLWAVGKMIGGDEEEVLAALVGEIDRLRTYAIAAVLAERERCARLCESLQDGDGSWKHGTPQSCAFAIRNR